MIFGILVLGGSVTVQLNFSLEIIVYALDFSFKSK